MVDSLKHWQPRIGMGLIVLGLLCFAGSLMLGGAPVWIIRMLALVLVASGLQWLPRLEQWLNSRVYEKLLIATSIGLALVWMLIKYSNS